MDLGRSSLNGQGEREVCETVSRMTKYFDHLIVVTPYWWWTFRMNVARNA